MAHHLTSRRSFLHRAFIVAACHLVMLQAFLSGLHATEMGAAVDETLAVICHSGDAPAERSTSGGKESPAEFLCRLCALTTTGTTLPAAPLPSLAAPMALSRFVYFLPTDAITVVLPPARAGPSRAPPQLA
jgi:hypothetical protein